MELIDLYKLQLNSVFQKPLLSPVDIDINNDFEYTDGILLPIFKAVCNNDTNTVKSYSTSNYIETNLKRQTPLMLATKLNNVNMVKLLLNECCQIDEDNMSALNYSIKYNSCSEIYDMLSKYELN
jgi:hypothetical protein